MSARLYPRPGHRRDPRAVDTRVLDVPTSDATPPGEGKPHLDCRCTYCERGELVAGHCIDIDGNYWHTCKATLKN